MNAPVRMSRTPVIRAVRWGKDMILSVAIALASTAMTPKFITPVTSKNRHVARAAQSAIDSPSDALPAGTADPSLDLRATSLLITTARQQVLFPAGQLEAARKDQDYGGRKWDVTCDRNRTHFRSRDEGTDGVCAYTDDCPSKKVRSARQCRERTRINSLRPPKQATVIE